MNSETPHNKYILIVRYCEPHIQHPSHP